MEDYKPNSHRFKEEQKESSVEPKKIEKVVKGVVKTKKKNEMRKLADTFISEDVGNIKSYAITEVLIPSIKKAISDIVTNGIDMILYGESGRTKKKMSGDYVSYRSYSDRRDDRRSGSRVRDRFDYDDLLFETRSEALRVLNNMEDVIDKYKFVTVADMFDMADVTAPYTANDYGWTSVRNGEVLRVRDGYVIKLPRALPIDK